jgi:hypothetical protein
MSRLMLLSLVACSGELDTPVATVRLTHTQWEHATADLLGRAGISGLSQDFVRDTSATIFDNDGESLHVNATLWQQYQGAAEALAQEVVEDPDRFEVVQWGVGRGKTGEADTARDAWIAAFGARAFRRPLTPDEVATHARVYDQGSAVFQSADSRVDGERAVITAMLQSPDFLYRVDRVAEPDGERLAPMSMATRLSFALWNTAPDDALTAAATAAAVDTDVLAEVPRMLQDERTHRMLRDLHRQLLHVDSYANIPREFVSYEDYDLTENAVMQEEVFSFVDGIVFGGGTLADLLTSRITWADGQVAEVYGVRGVEGIGTSGMEQVELPEGERGGLLTLSGFLALHASETEENLITRGAFVQTALLCANLPPPPAAATPLPEPEAAGESLRERIETHTAGCGGSCHADYINPIGFAFGRYDQAGRYQLYEADGATQFDGSKLEREEIDATGTYTFTDGPASFDGAVELSALLAADAGVHRCYASRLLSYLEGRPTHSDDGERLDRLAAASLAGAPILTLIQDIVEDPAFRAP